jgi:hypothetical protein
VVTKFARVERGDHLDHPRRRGARIRRGLISKEAIEGAKLPAVNGKQVIAALERRAGTSVSAPRGSYR